MPAISTMILNSLIMTGEKAIGGTLSSAEQTYHLDKMNTMLDSWSLDRALVYAIVQQNFALTAGTVSYTIGTGGTFNTTRPINIVNAFIRDSQNYDTWLEIIPQDRYDQLKVKSVGNSYPEYLYFNAAYVGGLATIYIYPAPIASLTLYINSYQPLQSFANVTTALALPPGYQRAIETNYAIESSPGVVSVSPELAKIARDAKAAISVLNLPEVVSEVEPMFANNRRSSILTGP